MRYFFNILGMLCLFIVFTNCSSGRRVVTLNSLRPAEISVSPEVTTLVLVDRTKFKKNVLNVAEGILTGELPEEDLAAVQAMMASFQAQLESSDRFQTRIAKERLMGNSHTAAMPAPLNWSEIESMCSQYQADAVIAFESFDTDFIVTHGSRKTKKTVERNGEKAEIKVDEFYANGVSNIKIGLRFYDFVNKKIIDQQFYKETGTWEAAARSKAEALAKLISKSNAVQNLCKQMGADYAYRISPMYIRITRSFRGKSKKAPELEQGSRYADVAQWKEAIDVWESGLNHARTKEAGYLAYNIAIAYEVLGDFDTAKEWAQTSYVRYGNRDAEDYYDLLNHRLWNEQLAEEQLQRN